MDATEKVVLLAELEDAHCALKHSPGVNNADFPAIDYVTMPLGTENKVEDTLVIPVCKGCLQGLLSDDWTLLYCLACNKSSWVYQPTAKLNYMNIETREHYHIIGLEGCPECSEKVVRIHYLDGV